MRITKMMGVAGLTLAATIGCQAAVAAPVAIDTLSVESLLISGTLSSDYPSPFPISFEYVLGPFTIDPPVVIEMGTYQDPISAGSLDVDDDGSADFSWRIYSAAGWWGAPPPNGTVDPDAGTIDVDLSSLRVEITGLSSIPFLSLPDPLRGPFWPFINSPTSGSYEDATGYYSLAWGEEIDWTDEDLGHLTGELGVTIVGSLTTVPVPPAVWLFGSGLVGLAGVARRKKAA